MNALLPIALIALGACAFWKAELLGRTLRKADGGRLRREAADFGADVRAYTSFVRLAGGLFLMLGVATLFRVALV